jgi:hypothetical protein
MESSVPANKNGFKGFRTLAKSLFSQKNQNWIFF